MILSFGNYAHPDHEAEVRIEVEHLRDQGNQFYAYRERWTISGFLQAADQNSVIAAVAALEAAYFSDNKDLILKGNDGSTVAAQMLTRNAIGGLRVVSGPSYPEGKGGEFSTYRSYNIAVEGLFSTGTVQVMAWTESLSFRGTGGYRFVHQQPLIGLPVKQQTALLTPIRVLQRGRATGFFGYPPVPPPQWPDAVKQDEIEITKSLPKRYGPPGNPTYVEFDVEWSYPHEGVGPFIGNPTPWPE